MSNVRIIQSFDPGDSTATSLNVSYRLGKVQQRGLFRGRWLDVGCADGSYTAAMLDRGVQSAAGVDVVAERIQLAQTQHGGNPRLEFYCTPTGAIPFPDKLFDGVFMNEVLEHVTDEVGTLRELYRVLHPGGHLVIISPNRGFPFECHGAQIGKLKLGYPVPLLPWLPASLSRPFMNARNYWPHEMRDLVARHGFSVLSVDFVWPVLDIYPWLPGRFRLWYQRHISYIDSIPLLRRLGVSTLLVARKQPAAT
jgi:SAM-dependent methyltransferase